MFPSGAQPLGNGSLMCLNISIFDDVIVEPTETFFVCGSSQQSSVVLLNGSCANINIEDNEGKTKRLCSSYLLNTDYHDIDLHAVTIIPFSPNNVHTVEVQRSISLTCVSSGSTPAITWRRKPLKYCTLCLLYFACDAISQVRIMIHLQR